MSLQKDKSRPLCPFGKDCFYQHRHDDGTPHVFKNGTSVCMRVSRPRLPCPPIDQSLAIFCSHAAYGLAIQ